MLRYIPPAQRQQNASKEAEDYAPRSLESLAISRKPKQSEQDPPRSFFDGIHAYYTAGTTRDICPRGTLNDCSARPGELAYIVLWRGQNPQWQTMRLIYVKSNLHLLRRLRPRVHNISRPDGEPVNGDAKAGSDSGAGAGPSNGAPNPTAQEAKPLDPINAADSAPPAGRKSLRMGDAASSLLRQPVAVFEWDDKTQPSRFTGYFAVADATFLPPFSPGLGAMMAAKRHRRPPKASQWHSKMGREWAVLRLRPYKGSLADVPMPWKGQTVGATQQSGLGARLAPVGKDGEDGEDGEGDEDGEDGGVPFDDWQLDDFDSGSGSDGCGEDMEDASDEEDGKDDAYV